MVKKLVEPQTLGVRIRPERRKIYRNHLAASAPLMRRAGEFRRVAFMLAKRRKLPDAWDADALKPLRASRFCSVQTSLLAYA
jgi:hypothetical protein